MKAFFLVRRQFPQVNVLFIRGGIVRLEYQGYLVEFCLGKCPRACYLNSLDAFKAVVFYAK